MLTSHLKLTVLRWTGSNWCQFSQPSLSQQAGLRPLTCELCASCSAGFLGEQVLASAHLHPLTECLTSRAQLYFPSLLPANAHPGRQQGAQVPGPQWGPQLWPGHTLAFVAIGGVDQCMEALHLSRALMCVL